MKNTVGLKSGYLIFFLIFEPVALQSKSVVALLVLKTSWFDLLVRLKPKGTYLNGFYIR
jgi:hypothetical protein